MTGSDYWGQVTEPPAPASAEPPASPQAAAKPPRATESTPAVTGRPASVPNEIVQNEMPPALAAELAAHLRRDPLFDPRLDASQMSRHLRKWWEKQAA